MSKKSFIALIVGLAIAVNVSAQSSWAGREYYNKNVIAGMVGDLQKDIDELSNKDKLYAEAEKEKGRKLTAKERAKMDEQVDKAIKMARGLLNGMKTSIKITFVDATNVVSTMVMTVSEDVLKQSGIGWAKRKLLSMASGQEQTEKGTYTVKGNNVYLKNKDGELDTLTVSADGKILTGKMDDKNVFKLTRTK